MVVETIDAAANDLTTYTIPVGGVFEGTLAGRGDADWMAVELIAGETYTFAMTGTGALNEQVDNPFLTLETSQGLLAAGGDSGNNSGPGLASGFTYTATASGTYYLDASAVAMSDTGSYAVSVTAGDHASYTIDMAAGALLRQQLSWSASAGEPATLSWSIRAGGVSTYDAAGNVVTSLAVSQAQRAAIHDALAMYSDVANLTFNEVNPGGTSWNATIRFGAYSTYRDGAGAFAYYPGSTAAGSNDGDVWLNDTSVSRRALPEGSYSFYTLLHELGHAMGLAHPSDYAAAPGVTITYDNNAQFIEDSQQYTVMSYFGGSNTTASFGSYPDTLMLLDIYAVQQLYGANMATRADDTTYGFHSTLAPGSVYDFTTNSDPELCVWDGGGNDTFDFSGFAQNQVIDLRSGAFSSTGGLTDNISIALGAVIENAVGGRGDDHIFGNAADNYLAAGAGSDRLLGGLGADTLVGAGGADTLIGGGGSDRLFGGSGNDRLGGGAMADLLKGLAGNDTLNGDLGSDRLFGGDGEDRLAGGAMADTLFGGGGNDRLYGGDGADVLHGDIGNDSLFGGTGQDTLDGGAGNDRLFGAAGADSFRFGPLDGRDTIGDFDPTVDRLVLERALVGDGATAASVIGDHARVVAAGVELVFDDGSSVLLRGLGDPALLDHHILILG